MKIKLETISPVHIGSGSKLINGIDFTIENNKAYAFDPNKVFDLIGEERLDQWVSTIQQGKNLLSFLETNSISYNLDEISYKVIEVDPGCSPSQELNECVSTVNLGPYIPGSSVKGAIRTLIVKEKFESEKIEEGDFKKFNPKNKRTEFKDRYLESKYFGRNATDKPWRMLQVGDTFQSGLSTKIYQVVILNLFRNSYGFKNETLMVEAIPPNVTTQLDLKINNVLMDLNLGKATNSRKFNKEYSHNHNLNTIENLFTLITSQTKAIVEKELSDWEIEEKDYGDTGGILDQYRKLKRSIDALEKNHNSCILRLGGHSGWRFTTGGWVLNLTVDQLTDETWFDLRGKIRKKNYDDKVMTPKTRKMTSSGQLMGFVKLTVV